MMDWDDWNEHISDEALAAFIDGNATAEEAFRIENAMASDETLQECFDIVNDSISISPNISNMEVWQGDYGFWEMGIPPVLSMGELNEWVSGSFDYGNSSNVLESFDIQTPNSLADFMEGISDGYETDMDNSIYGIEDTSVGFDDIELE